MMLTLICMPQGADCRFSAMTCGVEGGDREGHDSAGWIEPCDSSGAWISPRLPNNSIHPMDSRRPAATSPYWRWNRSWLAALRSGVQKGDRPPVDQFLDSDCNGQLAYRLNRRHRPNSLNHSPPAKHSLSR